jgi:hypothetical protein
MGSLSHVTVAVWFVRDYGLFTYQVIANTEADYFASQSTETLILKLESVQQGIYLTGLALSLLFFWVTGLIYSKCCAFVHYFNLIL